MSRFTTMRSFKPAGPSADKLGNFEIQRLMSQFNQAETLASNVQKKLDDTVSGQQQKIG